MAFFAAYLRQRRVLLLAVLAGIVFFGVTFFLYHLPLEAVAYPAGISLLVLLGALVWDARHAYRRHMRLLEVLRVPAGLMKALPEPENVDDQDYQALLDALRAEYTALQTRMDAKIADTKEYYTLWTHQIKTPISAMRLALQNEDSEFAGEIAEEVSRVEQYVEMALVYARLADTSGDYVIRQYDLDAIVCRAVRKFAGQFIRRRLCLAYAPLNTRVLTDEKWLLFVIEQVLSNALKYTHTGGVTISLLPNCVLSIRDTGVGIVPEDLPRIFEKGYTGANGRADQRASGIGLYLCRRICENLNHTISASSVPGEGTEIRLGLGRESTRLE